MARQLFAKLLGAGALALVAAGAVPHAAHAQSGTGWTAVCPATTPVTGTWAWPSLAFDPDSGQLILFGGETSPTTYLDGTWNWTGTTWTRLTPAHSPPARVGGQLAYDPATHQLLLVAGYGEGGAGGSLTDTWAWTGSDWTELRPATTPPPSGASGEQSLGYDPVSRRLVLFDGSASATWVWTGSDWLKLSPSVAPPARNDMGLATDWAHGRLILFGGYTVTGPVLLGDTWTWTGSTWQQLAPATSPSPRSDAKLGFDPDLGTLIASGGTFTPPVGANDTWAWDGATWSELSATTAAGPIAYDDTTHQMVGYDNAFTTILGDHRGAPGCGCPVPGAVNAAQSSFAASLAPPSCAVSSFSSVLANGAIVVGIVLFAVFPSVLFNRTYEENHERIRQWWERRLRWTARLRARLDSAVPESRRGSGAFAAVTVAGAVLGSALDPGFGVNARTGALILGVAAAICAGAGIAAVTGIAYRRRLHLPAHPALRALPSGLLVALVCVVVSRAAGMQPGYLYGVLGGVAFAGVLARHQEGHVVALTSVVTLAVSIAAWLLWVPVHSAASAAGASFLLALVEDFLAALFVSGLVGLVIGLVPLRWLPGHTLAAWHRGAWTATFGVAALAFLQIILRPESAPAHAATVPLVTTIVLFALFGAASVAFWACLRPRREGAAG